MIESFLSSRLWIAILWLLFVLYIDAVWIVVGVVLIQRKQKQLQHERELKIKPINLSSKDMQVIAARQFLDDEVNKIFAGEQDVSNSSLG